MKKLFSFICVVLFCLVLVSCEDDSNVLVHISVDGSMLGTVDNPTLTRLLVDKFNQDNKKIVIDLVEKDADIYFSDYYYEDNAYDISSYVKSDSEWKYVDENLKEVVTIDEKVYMVPYKQYYYGYVINEDFVKENLNYTPTIGDFDVDKFLESVCSLDNSDEHMVSISSVSNMINWLPAALDTENKLSYYFFNGERFDFKNDNVIKSLTVLQKLLDKKSKLCLEAYDDFGASFGSYDQFNIFAEGKIGFLEAYNAIALYDNYSMNFNSKFIGYPGNKVVSIPYYMYVTKDCLNPKEAYEVVKYLSFGKNGIKASLEILKESNKKLGFGLPVNMNMEIVNEWFNYINLPGLKDVFSGVSLGNIEAVVERREFNKIKFYNTEISIADVKDGIPLSFADLIYFTGYVYISIEDYKKYMSDSLMESINYEIIKMRG